MENAEMKPGPESIAMSDCGWDKIVVFTRGEDRHVIRDIEAAYKSLTGNWPDERGQSYRRAVDTCEAALAGERPGTDARITFVVALMEAGLQFQFYDDEISMLEDEVAIISRNMASIDGEE